MELTLDQALQKGIEAHKAGKVEEADQYYTAILKANPQHPDANHNMGVLAVGIDKTEEALPFFKTALEVTSNIAQYWLSYLDALIKLDRMDEAKEVFEQAKSTGAIGDGFDELEKRFGGIEKERVLNSTSDTQEPPDNQFQSIVNLYTQGKYQEALTQASQVLNQFPNSIDLYNIIGAANQALGNLDEAIKAYKTAISIKPDYPDAHNNMGVVLQQLGKLDEAIEAYNKALTIKPDYADAYYNMGLALQGQGKLEEAIEAYNKALTIKPDYADSYNNIGYALKDQGKLEEAIETYKKALTIKPDYAKTHENLSFVLLNNGRLKEGLDEYEWRWKTAKRLSTYRHFSQPLWDGKESLKGKTILLWSEQGIGDTINWSSCLSFVAAQAEHCILECPQKLIPLLTRSFPNVEFKPENRSLDSQRDDFDFHLPMGSLYRHSFSEISKASKADAFLIPDPARIKFWQKRLNSIGNGPYIGISWKSSNMSPQRMPNYASISDFAPIFRIPDATFINMQYNDFKGDLTKIQNEVGVKVHNFDDLDQFENLEDVAALSAALDIVVSTHNVLIMIAPRVGTLTKFASWRQSVWNNILLSPEGPCLKKFDRNTWEPWDQVFRLIAKDITENDFED